MHNRNIPSKNKLKRLSSCRDDIQQELKELAIHDKIFFYIILEKNGQAHQLHSGDLEKIHNHDPCKTHIIIEPHPSIPAIQNCGWNQVWINTDDEKKLLKKNNAANTPEILKYRTPLLEVMYKAIDKFWLNYNSNYPPKSDEIVNWLWAQGIAKRNALVIDTIIRPEHLKSGGNKSRKL